MYTVSPERVDHHLSNYPIPRKRGTKFYKNIFLSHEAMPVECIYCAHKNGSTLTHK